MNQREEGEENIQNYGERKSSDRQREQILKTQSIINHIVQHNTPRLKSLDFITINNYIYIQ